MMQIDYLDDENGNLTKVVVSDTPFNTITLSNESTQQKLYAIELTEDMEDCINQGWER